MIPFLDLRAQYESIREEVLAAVTGVLESGRFILGPEVAAFEEEFAAFCGVAHGVGLNSGTSALHMALLAAGVGPGDEVVTVPLTFVASVAAILYAGARPVLADVDPISLTMDPARLEAAITPRTKAVIPVHLYGQTADMDPIMDIARARSLTVIEDAAQAHGAKYRGRIAGSLGHMACFSFYPGKNLGAAGEAGMVVTQDPALAQTIRKLRDWGQREKYLHEIQGYNCRMEGIQGAVLRVKLRHLAAWTEARRRHAAAYSQGLTGTGLGLPAELPDREPVHHIYAVRSKNRDALAKALLARDIQTGIHYPHAVHLLPAYRSLGYGPGDFPVAEAMCREELSLPMFPELTPDQIAAVCVAVREHVRQGAGLGS